MDQPLVIEICACMAARPMASAVGGDPSGGVVGLSLSFPPWCHYNYVLVGGAGAARVA